MIPKKKKERKIMTVVGLLLLFKYSLGSSPAEIGFYDFL